MRGLLQISYTTKLLLKLCLCECPLLNHVSRHIQRLIGILGINLTRCRFPLFKISGNFLYLQHSLPSLVLLTRPIALHLLLLLCLPPIILLFLLFFRFNLLGRLDRQVIIVLVYAVRVFVHFL